MQVDVTAPADRSRDELLARNGIFDAFFTREAPRLARASREMARRFLAGGRLLAFGHGAAATDAQHVSVEFVHPVIVGKRALPALDLGSEFEALLPVVLQPMDMVMGFDLSGGDGAVERAVGLARERGAMTFSLVGSAAEYTIDSPESDPFVVQELVEVLYHLLWETVHVYFEHREQGHDVGASSFLYPFLGNTEQNLDAVVDEVERSMMRKVEEVNGMRAAAAGTEVETLAWIAGEVAARLRRGGKVMLFGNGGSATDANDFAIDCVAPPAGMEPIPAISLSAEPAILTAVANDIGAEALFARQLIAHATAEDVAIGVSTSGSSPNVLSALAEAARRGLMTVGLAGYDGGRMVHDGMCDAVLVVRSDYIPRIQEVQASLYHVLRRRIDGALRGDDRDA